MHDLPMHELLWTISFVTFLASVALNAAHAILALSLKKARQQGW